MNSKKGNVGKDSIVYPKTEMTSPVSVREDEKHSNLDDTLKSDRKKQLPKKEDQVSSAEGKSIGSKDDPKVSKKEVHIDQRGANINITNINNH